LLLALALGLLAAGCFKADMAIRVDEDGSGEIEWLIALDVEAAVSMGSAFATEDAPAMSPDDACADFRDQQDVPDGAEVSPYDEDGFCGLRYSVAFEPGGFEEALAASDADVGAVELSESNGGWFFELADTSALSGDLDTDDEFGAALLDDAEFTVRVFLPGRLVDHNATYIDSDGTAVWEIDLQGSMPAIFARTEPGATVGGPGRGGVSGDGGGSAAVPIVIAVVALLLVAAAVVVVKRRNAPATQPSPPSGSGSLEPPPSGSSLPPPPANA
jgi:hypothetical protein